MDVIKAVQNYLNKMTSEVSGMKALLMDQHTTSIISAVLTQSQLLSKEIYLIDRIENRARDKMKHLKCIVFVRPTPLSIQNVIQELSEPCFGDYHLYFSNTLQKSSIERLAEADVSEVVREVNEYFADFLAVNADLFSLGLDVPEYPLYMESPLAWNSETLRRVADGVCGVLLSLKKKPLIRYERNSSLAKKLAGEISYSIQNEGPLYDFRKTDTPPILLILDRRNDPLTPLLNQWTYQAMVHELLGIDNGRVDLSSLPEINPDMKQVVLSADQDPFYSQNMYLNMGDLGANIKSYVDEYQLKHHSNTKIESIADMKKFVEDYPEFKKLAGNVSKHVTIVGEISKRVGKLNLLEVGEVEQNLACVENHAADVKNVEKFVLDPNVDIQIKLRLVLLYALRYEKMSNNSIASFVEALRRSGLSDKQVESINVLLTYAGADSRLEDILLNGDILAKTKNVFQGLKGVDNLYTRHTPHLVNKLNELMKARLSPQNYPFLEGSTKDKPQDIIVFVIGGTTYGEAREIAKLNQANPGVRIVLGGTTIHNFQSFLKEMSDSVSRWTTTTTGKDVQNSSSDPPSQRTAKLF